MQMFIFFEGVSPTADGRDSCTPLVALNSDISVLMTALFTFTEQKLHDFKGNK